MDAQRPAGGHAGLCGNGPPAARADWLLPAAGRQRVAGSQRGAGPVDGHRPVVRSKSGSVVLWGPFDCQVAI